MADGSLGGLPGLPEGLRFCQSPGNLGGIERGKAFQNNIWHFGYAPDMDAGCLNPNCAACLKVLIQGTMQVAMLS